MSVLTLKALRERAKLTCIEAADKIGIASPGTIRAYEVGKFKINSMHVEGFCRTYQCTPEELAPYVSTLPPGRRGAVPGSLKKKRAAAARQLAVNGHGPPGALEARQKGKSLVPTQAPARIEINVTPDGTVQLVASWLPGTPQGVRLATMAGEMLVNIR